MCGCRCRLLSVRLTVRPQQFDAIHQQQQRQPAVTKQNRPVSQVVQRQRHAQEVGYPGLQRVVRVDERNEAVGKRLCVRGERSELAVVATRGLAAHQAVAVFLDDRDEILPVQGRVRDLPQV